jgi:hypothetical protein
VQYSQAEDFSPTMKTTGGATHLPICRAEIEGINYRRYNAANVQEKTSRMIQYEAREVFRGIISFVRSLDPKTYKKEDEPWM